MKKKVSVNDIKVVTGWDHKTYKRAKRNFERKQRKLERRQKFINKIDRANLSSLFPSMAFIGWMLVIMFCLGLLLSMIL